MYDSGVHEGGTAAVGGMAPITELIPPSTVRVVGPAQPGDVDSNQLPPTETGLWKVENKHNQLIFVDPDKLTPEEVNMRRWLGFEHIYNGKRIPSILNEWEKVDEIKQLLDIDIRDLKKRMSNEQLQNLVDKPHTMGREWNISIKAPKFKKLYMRLHHDLKYPLSTEQAKKIKVDPWPVKGGQLCAARQRLAFAQITELDIDTVSAVSMAHQSLTTTGPLAQNLHSVVLRSEPALEPEPEPASGGGRKSKRKTKRRRKSRRKKSRRKTRRKRK
jgi:hypothetical protein